VDLPALADDTLSSQRSLTRYLSAVAELLQLTTEARYVGIYLLDQATGRLSLRAWRESGRENDSKPPAALSTRGIDHGELTTATLRDYLHAAPTGQRIATPIHDDTEWIGALIGVRRSGFSDGAPAVFHDVAAQLAALASHSSLPLRTRQIDDPETAIELPSDAIQGVGVGGGVAVGPALVFRSSNERFESDKVEEDREQALERLSAALDETARELEQLISDAGGELYDVANLIFSTHLLMLQDEAFAGAMQDLVRAGQTPEDAVQSVVASFVRTFQDLKESRLAEKAHDVRDIGQRLRAHLMPGSRVRDEVTGHIAILHDALPSDLVLLAVENAAGVIIHEATVTAHISILAQSLGLPTLVTKDHRVAEIVSQTPLLVDADEGTLLISPTSEQLLARGISSVPESAAARVFAEYEREPQPESQPLAAESPLHVKLMVNVNLLNDARRGARAGAHGIGLYRSEFPFIIRNDYISEEEQYRIYRSIVETMPDKPVVLRTADIGGDKLLAGREEEKNPFLGVRGIRFSLANRDLFREQLRAMLRAGADHDLHIMFPMVSSTDEILEAREEIELCVAELTRRGVHHNPSPRLGAMVELPSAVITIEEFAEQTDFLSIGTNDLIMYLLAVDRTNERLSELYRSHHPVVLRTIAEIARRVGPKIDQLSICGESAADPLMVPFFLGIGIRKLSTGPRQLASVSRVIESCTAESSVEFAEHLLSIRTLREMDAVLRDYSAERNPASSA
jgi:phosphoenolpyruvate-protein phosphotransferase